MEYPVVQAPDTRRLYARYRRTLVQAAVCGLMMALPFVFMWQLSLVWLIYAAIMGVLAFMSTYAAVDNHRNWRLLLDRDRRYPRHNPGIVIALELQPAFDMVMLPAEYGYRPNIFMVPARWIMTVRSSVDSKEDRIELHDGDVHKYQIADRYVPAPGHRFI